MSDSCSTFKFPLKSPSADVSGTSSVVQVSSETRSGPSAGERLSESPTNPEEPRAASNVGPSIGRTTAPAASIDEAIADFHDAVKSPSGESSGVTTPTIEINGEPVRGSIEQHTIKPETSERLPAVKIDASKEHDFHEDNDQQSEAFATRRSDSKETPSSGKALMGSAQNPLQPSDSLHEEPSSMDEIDLN